MKVGMLWFDNDRGQPLDRKILRAAAYYKKKYGRTPSLCYVHPTMVNQDTENGKAAAIKSGKIEILTAPWVLPNHYWIGNIGRNEDD